MKTLLAIVAATLSFPVLADGYRGQLSVNPYTPNAVSPYEALQAERDGLLAQHHRDSAELRRIRDERDQSRRTAEHWKAEHLAGNAEIERLRGERERT